MPSSVGCSTPFSRFSLSSSTLSAMCKHVCRILPHSTVLMLMKIIFRYDYVTYPVWYLAQKPWRTKRVQRSIHSKWEVLFAQHSWNLWTNLVRKEPENGEIVYHSIVEPTAVNRDLRRYNLNTIEKVWFVKMQHFETFVWYFIQSVTSRCGHTLWESSMTDRL